MPRNVIIVGMPRSGTSLAASVFARYGYFVTADPLRDLAPPSRDNPTGFWEAQGLVDRNVEVLRAVGFAAHNTWGAEPITTDAIARIWDLEPLPGHVRFVEEYQQSAPWIWKDPRLCLTLPYWWRLIGDEKTAVLLMNRDLEEIYWSFRRVRFVEPALESRKRVDRLAAQHLGAASDALARLAIPHLRLDHALFFDDPDRVAATLNRFFEIYLEAADLDVRPELNHATWWGRRRTQVSALYMSLPESVRRLVLKLTPSRIADRIAPERVLLSSPIDEDESASERGIHDDGEQ